MSFYTLLNSFYSERPRLLKHYISSPDLKGLKILHISDVHGNTSILKKVLKIIKHQNLNYHLLLITGDLLNKKKQLNEIIELLSDLSVRAILFSGFVPGNNEKYKKYRSYFPKIALELTKINIEILSNRIIKLPFNNAKITICGLDDIMEGKPDILSIMNKVTFDKSRSILLCHVPSICFSPLFNQFSLVLSGHTHGGQINPPFTGPLYLNVDVLPIKLSSGMHKLNSTYFHISRGIGTSTVHFRLNCPPEATLIEMI